MLLRMRSEILFPSWKLPNCKSSNPHAVVLSSVISVGKHLLYLNLSHAFIGRHLFLILTSSECGKFGEHFGMQLVQVHSFFRTVTKAHKGVKFSCPRKNQKTTTTPTSTKCFYFHIHKGFSCMNHAKTDSRDFEEAKTAKISDHVFLTLLAIFVPVGSHLK